MRNETDISKYGISGLALEVHADQRSSNTLQSLEPSRANKNIPGATVGKSVDFWYRMKYRYTEKDTNYSYQLHYNRNVVA